MVLYVSGATGQHNAQLQAVITHAAALGTVQGAPHPALTNIMSGKYKFELTSAQLA